MMTSLEAQAASIVNHGNGTETIDHNNDNNNHDNGDTTTTTDAVLSPLPNTTTVQIVLPDPPRAAILQHTTMDAKLYWDRSHFSSPADQMKALQFSSTVYVGNLSFTIKTHLIHQHFTSLLSSSSSNGTSYYPIVKRIILGIDRYQKKPCGFCFVELRHRSDAIRAVSMLSGTQLDGKIIRVELDSGFQPGRQLGRGMNGGQVRDDKRLLQQQRNENMKRYRSNDTDDRSSSTQQSERPVRLDDALPSARNHSNNTTMGDPTSQVSTAVHFDEASNAMNNIDIGTDTDEQPSAKRMRRE
jgi:nuclear cap-binding protein subunit 2